MHTFSHSPYPFISLLKLKIERFRTVSNKDIFSSLDDDKSCEETDHASNEGENSEETNDPDEEADP